ncbi:hypothetical protein IQE94_09280 [Synechocystis sp. PCC 7339]|uniref:hypothetical protein n=1 Tax=unclassified Synechocystis TaxID=2640012 RepID=UPI001BAF256C|nr:MULTISPECIES: hypothetical protein [unclassified Synechocystis]QUS62194.1 hypothetical protein HTZ78_17045 [Synechocystis sp. PCC 7338]UAJ71378.1 hypothetical protein IQE94_09280 [Synechocystis sp. PCC 7339]
MEVFDPTPPPWVEDTVHTRGFCCPQCQAGPRQALRAWINRRSPVLGDDRRRKWQEFYQCECGQGWWAWSSDRPPSPQ